MLQNNLLETPVESAEFAVLDVETTGLSARTNNVIEIGIVKVKNLKIGKKYHTLINPGYNIPVFITQLTGITNDDIEDAPFFSDVVKDINNFIGDSIISGHNLGFDDSFLKYEFIRNGHEILTNQKVCTLKLARRLFPSLPSKSLSSVTQFLKLRNSNAHRALGDAEVTAKALIKMIKTLKKNNSVQTVGDLIEFQSTAASAKKNRIPKKLNDDLLSIPNAPGIYYFLNKKNEIIYVGKAKSLRDRIKSYFASTASKKANKIVKHAAHVKTEMTNSELTALLTEAETIKLIKPKYNTQLKKYGNKYFIKITKTDKYPRCKISNSFSFDGNDYFGLFISRKRAEKVMEVIDRTFALRECTDKEFAKKQKCFLADIERCTAPCIKRKDKKYSEELEQVYEFLCGKNQAALGRLLNKMKYFSSNQKYEKAAEIKEIIDLILSQTHKTSLLAEPVNCANVLFEITEGMNKDYILLLEGKVFIKSYLHNKKDEFDVALNDYYSRNINLNSLPTEEDLEKMKITLNWIIANRNNVKIFYLKEYTSVDDLYLYLSQNNFEHFIEQEKTYDINSLMSHPLSSKYFFLI